MKVIEAPQPVITPITKKLVKLEEPCHCIIEHEGKEYTFHARPGFVWDKASIPRIAWTLLGVTPGGMMLCVSLWHDTLYMSKGNRKRVPYITLEGQYSRKESDKLLELLAVYHTYHTKRAKFMYFCLRIGGRRHWGRERGY